MSENAASFTFQALCRGGTWYAGAGGDPILKAMGWKAQPGKGKKQTPVGNRGQASV